MAKGHNSVTILGGLVREPEVKTGASGAKYMRAVLAVGFSVKNKSTGAYEEQTDYINCTIFGNQADVIEKYCTKGSQIMVVGKLKTSKYTGKDGEPKYETYVQADDVYLAGGKRKDGDAGNGGSNVRPMSDDLSGEDPNDFLGLTGAGEEVNLPF